jgi:hypothetical protein
VTAIWEAQTLRVTFFPTEATAVSSDWWIDFTGVEPDSESKHPKAAIVVVSGSFEGRFLSISSGAGRVDLVFQPVLQTSTSAPNSIAIPSATIGPADALLDVLCERIAPICERMKSVDRLALGGVFLKAVVSHEEAYNNLKMMLKSVTVDPENMRDLVYRVNWPVRDDQGRVINRLGAWSTILAKGFGVTAGAEGPALLSEDHYVSFEFDINTAPEKGVHFGLGTLRSELLFLRRLLDKNLELGEVVTQ